MNGSELREARKRLGVSGARFAKAMRVHERTLRAWEAEERDGKPVRIPDLVTLLTKLAIEYPRVRHRLGLSAGLVFVCKACGAIQKTHATVRCEKCDKVTVIAREAPPED